MLVVPPDVQMVLPHAAQLNYCQFSFLVQAREGVPLDMHAVLARLEKVSAAEAAAKHAALRRVRDAFVWREPGHGGPSAADYVLQAACAHIRRGSGAAVAGDTINNRTAGSRLKGGAAGMLQGGGSCVLA